MKTTKKKEDTSLKDFLDALDEIQKTKGIDKEEIFRRWKPLLFRIQKRLQRQPSARAEIDRRRRARIVPQKKVVENVKTKRLKYRFRRKKNKHGLCAGDIVD
jgi:hypothetical protein